MHLWLSQTGVIHISINFTCWRYRRISTSVIWLYFFLRVCYSLYIIHNYFRPQKRTLDLHYVLRFCSYLTENTICFHWIENFVNAAYEINRSDVNIKVQPRTQDHSIYLFVLNYSILRPWPLELVVRCTNRTTNLIFLPTFWQSFRDLSKERNMCSTLNFGQQIQGSRVWYRINLDASLVRIK
jgi:hypothetical protein